MLYQDVQINCGCETTCCDRHLTPVQDQASGCCSSTAAATASCGCASTASSESATAQAGAKSLNIYSGPEVGSPLTGVEQETPENLKRFFAAREKQLTKEL